MDLTEPGEPGESSPLPEVLLELSQSITIPRGTGKECIADSFLLPSALIGADYKVCRNIYYKQMIEKFTVSTEQHRLTQMYKINVRALFKYCVESLRVGTKENLFIS